MEILREPHFGEHVGDWTGPWTFEDAPETEERLRKAGFTNIAANVIDAPVVLDDEAAYREFLQTVVLGSHLERIPDADLRNVFIDHMVAGGGADDPPWSLAYTRLNLQGRRPI